MAAASAVGNDVVDLEDPAIATSHLRPRFVERVCAPGELALLSCAADPRQLLWSLFAAKEAAYKAVARLGPRPILGHRRFVVAPDLRSVEHEGRALALRVEVTQDYVHAVVGTDHGSALGEVERLPEGCDPGSAARRLLSRGAARILDVGEAELEVVRPLLARSWDGRGPPVLLLRGHPAPLDVSLSHDGRFVAFAARPDRSELPSSVAVGCRPCGV